jgi:tetratricopeptide (TPR) repeat protein
MRTARLILLAALPALAGCGSTATGPPVNEAQKSMPAVPPDGARVFFYRPYNYVGSGGDPTVIIDNAIVATATNVSALYCDLAAGQHFLQLGYKDGWHSAPIAANLAGGQLIYVEITPAFPQNYFAMHPDASSAGGSAIQAMHLVEAQCPVQPRIAGKAPPKGEIEQALTDGASAEGRGERAAAIAAYTDVLRKHPEGIASVGELVNHAIDDALILHPPPAVPADAKTHTAAALKIVQSAKTKADLAAARLEYQSALALAPWWADVWFNLAALDEQLGADGEASFALETYLRSAPDAPDKDRIEKKLEELRSKAKSS